MAADVLVPPFAQCGWREPLARDPEVPWMTQMYEANLWMSFNEVSSCSELLCNAEVVSCRLVQ